MVAPLVGYKILGRILHAFSSSMSAMYGSYLICRLTSTLNILIYCFCMHPGCQKAQNSVFVEFWTKTLDASVNLKDKVKDHSQRQIY